MGVLDRIYGTKDIDPTTGLSKEETEQKAIDKKNEELSNATSFRDVTAPEGGYGYSRTSLQDADLFEDAQRGSRKLNEGQVGRVNVEEDDLEDIAAFGQSRGSKWANGLTKFVGKTGTAAVGGVGALVSTIGKIGSYAFTDDSAKDHFKGIFDNNFQKGLDNLNEAMDGKLPNYVSKEEREYGFFRSMGTANFWANDFTNGLSFIAGAVLTEAALTAASVATFGAAAPVQAAATAGIVARAARMLKMAEKGSKAAKSLSAVNKVSLGMKARQASVVARRLLSGAGYESGVEARHHLDSVKKDLIKSYMDENDGAIPEGEDLAYIQDLATQSANAVFGANLALVGYGNALQFPKIFGAGARSAAKKEAVKKARRGIIKDATDGVVDPFKAAYKSYSKGRKVLSAGYHVLRNPFYEGFVEEGGQKWIDLAGQHASAESYANGYRGNGINAAMSLVRAADDTFSDAYGSKDSQKEIGIGFLLGAMGLPSFAHSKNEDGTKGKRKFDGMQGGVWDGLRDRAERREHIDRLVKYMNGNPSAVAAVKRNFTNYSEQVNLQEQMDAALAENNMFAYKNLENDALFSYLHSRIEGGFYNDIKSEMEEVRNMSDEEFVQEFGYENENLTSEEIADRKDKVVSSALDKAAKIKEATEAVDKAYLGENEKIRRGLIHAAATIENVDRREEEISNMIDDITGGAMRTDKDSSLYDQMRGSTEKINTGRQLNQIDQILAADEVASEEDKLSEQEKDELLKEKGRLQEQLNRGPAENTQEDEALLNQWAKQNPTEAAKLDKREEVLALLRDLRMLRQRRQDFLINYNKLLVPTGQDEYLQMVDFFMDQNSKDEEERRKLEQEQAIRDNDMQKIFEGAREDEFVVDVNGDGSNVNTYKFLDANTLYNVKDGKDQIPSNLIFNNGARTAALIEQLDQRGIERRKVKEAVQRIQATNVDKIADNAKAIKALDERLAKAIGVIAERLANKNKTRDAKGRFVSIKEAEALYKEAADLQAELLAQRDKLLADQTTLQENQAFLDKMLKATESSESLSMEEKLELEKQVKAEGLEALSLSGTTLQQDGTQRLSTQSELLVNADSSLSRTEQALEEVMLQVDIMEDDIQKLQDYKDVLNSILKEDRLLKILNDFRLANPGVEPTYESITKYTNEQRQKYPNLYEIQSSLTPDLFAQLPAIEKAKKDQKFLQDELYATEEKLNELQNTVAAIKRRENILLQLAENKYKGMSKVQRSILFGRNYKVVQNKLSAINQEEQTQEDIARGANKETLAEKSNTQTENTSSEELYQDDPEDFGVEPKNPPKEKEDDRYKPDLATVGHNKTAGVDEPNKLNNEDPNYMSPSQRRFFKWIDSTTDKIIRSQAYKVVAVTQDNNPYDNEELKKTFRKKDHIILVVVHAKTGKAVKIGDNLVYTSMMEVRPIEDFSGIEGNEELYKQAAEEHKALRELAISKEKGKNISMPITGLSKGMPHYAPKVQGQGTKMNRLVFPKNSVLGRLTDSLDKISRIPLVVATRETIAEFGQRFKAIPGAVYALHKGRPVRMENRNLVATEIETILQVLTQYGRASMSTDPEVRKNADVIQGSNNMSAFKYLKETIKFGRWEGFTHNPKFNIHTRMESGIEMLYVGGVKMDIRTLDPQASVIQRAEDPSTGVMKEVSVPLYNEANVKILKEFLAKKTHNVDNTLLKDKQTPYTEFTIDSEGNFIEGKTYTNYAEYLMMPREGDSNGAPLGTALVQEDADNVNLTQFKFTYLKFGAPKTKPVQKPETKQPEAPDTTDVSTLLAGVPNADPAPTTPPAETNPQDGDSSSINSDQMTQGQQYDLVYTTAEGKQSKFKVAKTGANNVLDLIDPDNAPAAIKTLLENTNKMALEGTTFNEAFETLAAASANITGNLTIENIVLDSTVVNNETTIENAVIEDSAPIIPDPDPSSTTELFGGIEGADFVNSILEQYGDTSDPNEQPTDDDVQNLLKEVVTEKYEKANLDKEIAWFENKFPGIPIKVVQGLIDGKAYGQTLKAARVLISDLAVKGTTYHEAFHIVMGKFTDTEAKKEIFAAYSKITGVTENVEEALAEEFRTYMLLDGNYKIGEKANKDRNLIQRFFKSLRDFFNNMLGRGPKQEQAALQQLFAAIKNNTFSMPSPNAESEFSMDKRVQLANGTKLPVAISRDLIESLISDTFGFFFTNSSGVETDLTLQDLLELADRQHSEARVKEINRLINEAFKVRLVGLAKVAKSIQKSNPKEAQSLANLMRVIDQNRAEIKQAMFDWLSQFKVEFEGTQQEESTKFRDSYNIAEANEVNAKELAPALVKLLIATLPASRSRRNVNSVAAVGLVDYRPFFNLVMRELAGTESFEDQIAKLEALKTSHPEFGDVSGRKGTISFLVDRLKANDDVDGLSPNEFKLQRQFRQQFHKFNSEDMLAIIEDERGSINKNSIRFIKANADRESALLIEEFRSNLKEMFSLGKGPFKKDPATEEMLVDLSKKMKIGKRQLSLNDFAGSGVFSSDDVIDLLENFGIVFTDRDSLTSKEKNSIYENAVEGVIPELIKLAEDKMSIEDFYSVQSGAYGRIKNIIAVQAKRTDKTIDLQFQNAEGKTVYSIILNNFATNIISRLNSGKIPSFMLDKAGNVLESMRGSLLLDGAMNNMKVVLGSINGIKKKSSRFGNVFENASPRRRFNTQFASVMQGIIPMIRASEKKTEFIFDLTQENDEGKSIFKSMPKTRAAFVEQMTKYLRMEIYKAKIDSGSNIADYQKNKNKLRLFSYLQDVIDLEAIDVNKIDEYLEEHKTAINAGIIQYLEKRNAKMIQEGLKTRLFYDNKGSYGTRLHTDILKGMSSLLSDKAVSEKELSERDLANIVERFNMISLVGNIEQTVLILGDVGFFKEDSYFKRTSGPHGPKKFADVSDKINQWLASNYKRLDGKSPDGRLRTTVYKDVKGRIADETFIEYAATFGADPNAIRAKLQDPNVTLEGSSATAYEALKGYLEFEEGDAQGYITLDEYMEFLERVGDVTPNQRAAYAKLQRGETLSAEEIAYFTPLKPQYYGPTYNEKLYTPAFYKLSLLPVYPQLMNSINPESNLARMYNDMQKNQVGLTVFESGVKVGKIVDKNGETNNFYTETGTYEGIQPANIQELYYEYMGIQVEMGEKVKSKTVRGTQQRALLASNAYDNGTVLNKEVVALDKILGELENETVYAQFEQLLDDFGIEEDDGEYYIDDKGAEKFTELLMDEARRRDMSDSYIEGLEEFLASENRVLDLLGNKPKIENLLYSLAANRVIRYKTHGAAKVQVASTGFESQRVDVPALYQDKHTFGANVEALKFYRQENGETMAMEVMLPHYFKELLGENVDVREDGIYKDGEKIGNSDLLEIFGYRIPTSALNSIDAIVIKGFLPDSAGEAIMMPSEIVVKSGSDYDIDKMTLYFPNYEWNKGTNKLSKIKYLTNGNSTVEERVKQLRKQDPKKYKLLLAKLGFKESAMKAFASLSDQFKNTRIELAEHLRTDENQEVLKKIDELYAQKRKATKSQKENLDIEIGLNLSRLIKVVGLDDSGADVSLQSQLAKIESLFERLDSDLTKALEKDAAKENPTISIAQQNSQKAIDNRILDASRKIVLNPGNFEQLIRPVSADRTKQQANEIRGAKGMSQETIDFSKLMEFEYIQEMGTRFWVGKQALGVAAVTNTHQIKAQRAGLALNTTAPLDIPFPHHAPEVDEDGNMTYGVGHATDVTGENYISEIIGEFINAFVDVAKDPFVFDINANLITSGLYFGLLRVGVPLNYITRYMAQDAIVKFVALKSDSPGVPMNELTALVTTELNAYRPALEDHQVQGGINTLEGLETLLGQSSEIALYEEAIDSGKSMEEATALVNLTKEQIHDYYSHQVEALSVYETLSLELAGPLAELQSSVVADRGGMTPKSRMETRLRNLKLGELILGNQFSNLNKYLEESFQAGFEFVQQRSADIFNNLFVSDRDSDARALLRSLLRRVLNMNTSMDDKAKYGDLVEHNFVSYILSTIGEKGNEIHTHTSRLFQGNEDTPSLPRRIKGMKDEMLKSGKKSLILNELFPILQKYDPTDGKFRIENLKKFSKRLTTYDRNALIEDFQVLMDANPELADDIVRFIIIQSGQMTSPISFLDIVPAQHYMRVVEPIINNFLMNPGQHNLTDFTEQFIRNNHKNTFVVERLKEQYLGREDIENMAMGMYKKLKSDEVKIAKNIASRPMPTKQLLKDYITVELEDPSLTVDEKKVRKKRKQSTKEIYLFKLAPGMRENQAALQQHLAEGKSYASAKAEWKTVKWAQILTLGDGMFLKEYGPGKHVSVIRKNNITRDNIDYTNKTADRNLRSILDPLKSTKEEQPKEISANQKIVKGDIFAMDGIPVITTNADGSINGLASIAKTKNLVPSKEYSAKPSLVSVPMKATKDASPTLQAFITQIGNLDNTIKKSPKQKFLVSLLGLGPIDAQSIPAATYDAMLSGLKTLIDSNPNAVLVLPDSSNPMIKDFVQTMETYFKC